MTSFKIKRIIISYVHMSKWVTVLMLRICYK